MQKFAKQIIIISLFLSTIFQAGINISALAQTSEPPPGYGMNSGEAVPTGTAAQTQPTDPASPYYNPQTTLIQQAAEQNAYGTMSQNVNNLLVGNTYLNQYNSTYLGLHAFFGNDIVGNLFSNIGQLFGKWLTELIDGWVAQAAQFLTAFLRTFVLNPNIAVNGIATIPGGPTTNDGISQYIREGANVMYGIAIDLLLLLFILCIWRYWVDAAWRGNNNLMGAVGRLIFTSGLLLAWPTLYAFEIQITNEMIKAIYFDSTSQVLMLDSAIAAAIKGGLVAGGSLLVNAFAPVLGATLGGVAAGSIGGALAGGVGEVVSYAALVIYLILGVALISELIYILVLKAIQTALLTAQYMFAPIFLVFMATPDTENIASGFIRSFVEVSLWTFVWVGLLKVLVIIIFSGYNPWGQIVLCVGILQIMIQVPSFLSRAQISPMSDYISAGMVTGGLVSMAQSMGKAARARTGQFFDWYTNQRFAAAGMPQSQTVDLNNLPNGVSNPGLLNNLRDRSRGKDPNKGGDGSVNLGDGKGVEFPKDANGNPIKPPPAVKTPTKPGQGGKDGNKKPTGTENTDNPNGKNVNPIDPNAAKKPGENPASTDASKPNNLNAAGNKANSGSTGTPAANIGTSAGKTGNSVSLPGSPVNSSKTGTEINSASGTNNAKTGNNSNLNTANITTAPVTPPVKAPTKPGVPTTQNPNASKNINPAGANNGKEDGKTNLTNEESKNITGLNATDKNGITSEANATSKDTASNAQAIEPGKTNTNGNTQTTNAGLTNGNTDPSKIASSKNPLLGSDGKPLGSLANGANNNPANNLNGIGNAGQVTVPPVKTSQTQKANTDKANGGTAKQDVESELHTQLDQNGQPITLDSNLKQQPGQTNATGNLNPTTGKIDTTGNQNANGLQPPNGQPLPITPNTQSLSNLMADLKTPVLGNGVTLPNISNGQTAKTTASGNGANNTARQELDTQVFHLNDENGRPVTVETSLKPAVSQVNNTTTNPNLQQGNVNISNGQATNPAAVNPFNGTPTPVLGNINPNIITPLTGNATSNNLNTQGKMQSQVQNSNQGNGNQPNQQAETELNVAVNQGNGPNIVDNNIRLQGTTLGTPMAGSQAGNVQFNNGNTVSHSNSSLPGANLATNIPITPPVAVPGSRSFNPGSNWTGTSRAIAGGLSDVAIANGNVDATTTPTFSNYQDAPSISDPILKNNVNDESVRPAQMFTQPNYMHVLPRGLATDIRTAQGPTQETSPTGRPNIVGNGKGTVNHIRYGANATREQEAMQMYVAGYAGALNSDSEAYDAARQSALTAGEDGPQGAMENAAAGFMAFSGGNFRQTALAKQRFQRSLFKHAVLGSEAYVSGQSGNAYTEYLRVRYGSMTPDKQAWSTHIMTDPESPESGWSGDNGPATDTLLNAGIPITEPARAAAANKNLRKLPMWARIPAIKGLVNYEQAVVDNMAGANAHPMEKAALVGHIGPNIKAPEVGAVTAIYSESATPDEDTGNIDLVQEVARLGSTPMYNGDYGRAYKNIRAMIGHMGSSGGSRHAAMPPMTSAPVGMNPSTGGGNGGSGPASNISYSQPANGLGSGSGGEQTVMLNFADEANNLSPSTGNLGNITGNFGQSIIGQPQVNYVTRQSSGNSNGQTARVQEVNVTNKAQAYSPNITESDIAHQVSKSGADLSSKIHSASQIIMNLHNAGFSNNELAHPQIAQTAYEVHNSDPSMLYSASIASRVLGPANFTPQTVQVVQQMIDSGWSGEQISRPDVITAQSIMSNSGSSIAPSPRIVQTLRRDPRFQPSMNSFIPNDLLKDLENQNNYGRNSFGGNNGGGRNNGQGRNNF